jgi:hypothetical protein
MTPRQFNFTRRFCMRLPPTRQGAPPGSCALLIETDGDQDGQIFWTGGASPANRDAQGVHRRIEAGQDGQIRCRRRRAMMTFAALVVAAILVASTLYAMFSRTR